MKLILLDRRKQKIKRERSKGSKRVRWTTKTPLFGILGEEEKYGYKWYPAWNQKR